MDEGLNKILLYTKTKLMSSLICLKRIFMYFLSHIGIYHRLDAFLKYAVVVPSSRFFHI